MKPAIVIIAYNRPAALHRLLQTVSVAKYDGEKPQLVISIDGPANREVISLANNFPWQEGKKKVVAYDRNLGTKAHISKCGDLLADLQTAIFLEDDLVVSPFFYRFALAAGSYFEEEIVAGISLYSYAVAESSYQQFLPVEA